ncbi:MAG TPA: PEP-CTERM sorting domain-containing protein [Tepidisphaeraceae bacterium]|nr:PEP-CTERM sorting domain-containing protein [Tepidisphaeraceae bacterium]
MPRPRVVSAALAAALTIAAPRPAHALTIVVDFKSIGEPNTTGQYTDTVSAFNHAAYGFTDDQLPTLISSIMTELNRDYKGIPTKATLPASPINAGFELNIDFVVGNIGQAPSNGDAEYYYAQIGTYAGPVGGTFQNALGVAAPSSVRNSNGTDGFVGIGAVVASIFTNNIRNLPTLTPSNALTSGDLTYSTYAIEGTLAHEIAHTLSLDHINKAGSVQPNGLPPLMGTGVIDLPNQDRIMDREFSLSGINGEQGGAAEPQIAQLVAAVGVRAVVPEPGAAGVLVLVAGAAVARRRRRCA